MTAFRPLLTRNRIIILIRTSECEQNDSSTFTKMMLRPPLNLARTVFRIGFVLAVFLTIRELQHSLSTHTSQMEATEGHHQSVPPISALLFPPTSQPLINNRSIVEASLSKPTINRLSTTNEAEPLSRTNSFTSSTTDSLPAQQLHIITAADSSHFFTLVGALWALTRTESPTTRLIVYE